MEAKAPLISVTAREGGSVHVEIQGKETTSLVAASNSEALIFLEGVKAGLRAAGLNVVIPPMSTPEAPLGNLDAFLA